MRLALLAIAAFSLTAFAGCTDSTSKADEPPVGIQYEDETIQVPFPKMPREAPAPGERTLAKAPEWRLGEYWTYRLTDNFTGTQYEFTRVVAGEEGSNYLVGFPIDAFSNDVMIFHVPGYGDIQQSDLSYETHDARFQPLLFPLTDGLSWEMDFEGQSPGTATVSLPGDGTAAIEYDTQSFHMTATYDPEMGELSKLTIENYVSYEVIAHGYGYEGVVRVPHDHDLVFFHGRFAGVADINSPLIPPTAAQPSEEVVLGGTYDQVSFTIILGGGQFLGMPEETATGYFSDKVTAPDGSVFELTMAPPETGIKIEFYGLENPVGTWKMEHTAAGPGLAFVEGIGYHSIDVDLPSGCVLQSQKAQHHNADCKVEGDAAA